MQGLMDQWWRLGGGMAITFIVLFVVFGFGVQGEPPVYDDSIDDIREFWNDDGDAYLLGDVVLGLISTLLFLPFLVTYRTMLGRVEGGIQLWSTVAFYGGLLVLVFAATSSAAWIALAFAGENLDDGAVTTLMYLDLGAWHAFPYAVGLLTLFSSIVLLQTGVLWKWLGVIGLIVGVSAFITPFGILDDASDDVFDSIGIITFLGFAIWTLLTGVGMVMKKEEPLPRAGMTAAAPIT